MTRPALTALLLVALVAACGGSEPSATPVAVPASPTDPPPTVAATVPVDGPPAADLAAEGGDPVEGQLGTYTWGDGGSDAPWLPGAPLAVGAGEPLTMTLRPDTGIASWTVRVVPAAADGPAGAEAVTSSLPVVLVTAPVAGAWTLQIEVTFADDLGQASYFWALDVS